MNEFMGSLSPILLVEDNEDDAFLMVRALKSAGVEMPLRTIADGREALNYLSGVDRYVDRSEFPLPSLMFLDIKLPQVSGLEVLRWLRTLPDLRLIVVIILTSSNHPGDVREAYELGANSYVVKPASYQQLVDFARAFKAYWLQCNRGLG
jgi:CheY-like chemotaxis protein